MRFFLIALLATNIVALSAFAADPVIEHLHRIGLAAERLFEVASAPHSSVEKVADAAEVVVGRFMQLNADMSQYPDSIARHADTVKAVSQDQVRLGAALIELGGSGDRETIEEIADIASRMSEDAGAIE